MKKIVLLIWMLPFVLLVSAQDLQKNAIEAYQKGNFAESAKLYESILKTEGESADLYFNLGNAYYKSDRIPESILNYEKALLLAPGDDDIQHNLEIAKLKIVDKITPVGTFLLTDWKNSVQTQLSSNGWARLAISMFLIFVVALFLYFFAGRVWLKKISFFGGLFVLMLSMLSNYFAYAQKSVLEEQHQAIVFSPSVVAKSTPDESGTDLFLLHQGTKVTLKDKVGRWSRVALEDGNDGWIQDSNFQLITLLK